jgi:Ca2+-binding RTX toxin-like protein
MEETMIIDKTKASNIDTSWHKLIPPFFVDVYGHDYGETLKGGDALFGSNIYAGDGNDTVYAGSGNDTVYGGRDDDLLYGEDGEDWLYGEQGTDRLVGGAGADHMFGGMGDDFYWVDNTKDQVLEAPGDGYDVVYSSVDFTLPDNVETLALYGFAIAGIGNSEANHISGTNGDNYLEGGGGKDDIRGFNGMDTLAGGADADTFVFFNGLDDGAKTILDFQASGLDHDFIELHDYAGVGIHDFASLQNHMYDDLAGAVIDLGGGNQITLLNVYTNQLSASDFHIF